MIVSLNEIAATSAKAAVGCGYGVGIGDEMGFAVRWLCRRELPGLAVILAALEEHGGSPPPVDASVSDGGTGDHRLVASSSGGPLPAAAVAPSLIELVLADRPDFRPVRVARLTHPLLLVPFAARAAVAGGGGMVVGWSSAEGSVLVEARDRGARIRAATRSALTSPVALDVVVAVSNQEADPSRTPDDELPIAVSAADLRAASERSVAGGCSVDDAHWERLRRLAWRTYVPVSDESRLRGAGAGLTDND